MKTTIFIINTKSSTTHTYIRIYYYIYMIISYIFFVWCTYRTQCTIIILQVHRAATITLSYGMKSVSRFRKMFNPLHTYRTGAVCVVYCERARCDTERVFCSFHGRIQRNASNNVFTVFGSDCACDRVRSRYCTKYHRIHSKSRYTLAFSRTILSARRHHKTDRTRSKPAEIFKYHNRCVQTTI